MSTSQKMGLASDFTICYSEPKMLTNGKRTCDVCYGEIAKGEKYIAHKMEKGHVPLALVEREVDAEGNVQLDICLDCRTITGMSGSEVLN